MDHVRGLDPVQGFAYEGFGALPIDDPDWDVGVADVLASPVYTSGEMGAGSRRFIGAPRIDAAIGASRRLLCARAPLGVGTRMRRLHRRRMTRGGSTLLRHAMRMGRDRLGSPRRMPFATQRTEDRGP